MKKILLSSIYFLACMLSIQAQTLYDVSANGGNYGGGTINKFVPATNNLTVLKSFESIAYNPYYTNFIQASDGKLYGMTANGGNTGYGVTGYGFIFSFDPVSSTYTNLKQLDTTNGCEPYGSLMQATDGKLYGMTSIGGSGDRGVIFSFDPTTSAYTRLRVFDDADGYHPYGSLIQANDGKLYGMTSAGGIDEDGVIFSFDPATSAYTKLKDFDGTNGAAPCGSLIQASNGKLYGMTQYGGTNNVGVIFSFDLSSSTYTKLKDLDFTNKFGPYGNLIQVSDGKLYGMTYAGGSNDLGVIFSFDPSSSTYTKLKDFDGTDGAYPYGNLMKASDGKLYAMTSGGGSSNIGVIFSFDPSSSTYAKLKDFDTTNGANPYGSLMQATDGKLYGMTNQGGAGYGGVIYSFDPSTSTYTKLKDFLGTTDGRMATGSLVKASDGKLYGMTTIGGLNFDGVIYSFDLSTSTYTKLKDFDDNNGSNPYGSLIQASDGKLYGMTSDRWSGGHGVIFSFDPSTSTYTKLKDFDGSNGANPYGSLMQASDGKLYGMTNSGGSNDNGVIFSFDPSAGTYTKLRDFDGVNGAYPSGSLIQANDGKLYSMTGSGGSGGYGVIFSFDPSSSTYTKLKDFDNTNGGEPYGSLMQAKDGKLYGMTAYGGSDGDGVIFSFDPTTSTYTKLKDFDVTDIVTNGVQPWGNLMQASDGKMYGITSLGGANSHGVIFSFDPLTLTYTKQKDFDSTADVNPLFGSAFIEVAGSGTLPVTLISFIGKNNGASNQLSWKVENEQNLNYYELQRSIDGQHFTDISQIKAAGNNGYTYNDPIATVVSSIYYYRLKIVDKDGKFTYSKICLINCRKTNNIIGISPNPVTNLLRIATSSGDALAGHSATATIHIYSSAMQLVQSINVTQADRNAVIIPVDRLAKGVYFLQLINTDGVRTVKFVKE